MPYRVVETDAQLIEKAGVLLVKDEDSAAPKVMETTIATLASGTARNITEIYCSCDTPAIWRFYKNAVEQAVVRTSERTFHWDFNAYGITDTDVITVSVFPQCRRATAQADVSIFGYEVA